MKEKLKSLIADDAVFYTFLILLVAVVSFGLGRESIVQKNVTAPNTEKTFENQAPEPLKLQKTPDLQSNTTVSVVASKSGSKYHLPTCPGAKQIKPTNIIEFTSISEAEAAGYTPAANCSF